MKLPASIAAAFDGHEDAVLVAVADIDRGLVDPTDIYLLVDDARVEIDHVIDAVDVKLFVAAVTGASLGLQTALVEGGVKVQTIASGNSAVDVHVTNPEEANCPSQLMFSPDELSISAGGEAPDERGQ